MNLALQIKLFSYEDNKVLAIIDVQQHLKHVVSTLQQTINNLEDQNWTLILWLAAFSPNICISIL